MMVVYICCLNSRFSWHEKKYTCIWFWRKNKWKNILGDCMHCKTQKNIKFMFFHVSLTLYFHSSISSTPTISTSLLLIWLPLTLFSTTLNFTSNYIQLFDSSINSWNPLFTILVKSKNSYRGILPKLWG